MTGWDTDVVTLYVTVCVIDSSVITNSKARTKKSFKRENACHCEETKFSFLTRSRLFTPNARARRRHCFPGVPSDLPQRSPRLPFPKQQRWTQRALCPVLTASGAGILGRGPPFRSRDNPRVRPQGSWQLCSLSGTGPPTSLGVRSSKGSCEAGQITSRTLQTSLPKLCLGPGTPISPGPRRGVGLQGGPSPHVLAGKTPQLHGSKEDVLCNLQEKIFFHIWQNVQPLLLHRLTTWAKASWAKISCRSLKISFFFFF